MFSFNILTAKTFGFLLLLLDSEGASFGVYEVKQNLTPIGWAAIIIFPVALILGAIYFIVKILKKPKLK